jgi:hypothetical protein
MFRFTIRELVLLTLVVAMGVAWWIDRSRLAIPAADYQRLKAADPVPTVWDVVYGVSANAAKLQRLDQLKELIKQGADISAPIGFNRMLNEGENPSSSSRIATAWPLDVAVRQAQEGMVKLLLANGAKFHGGELANAAFAENHDVSLAMVKALIEAGGRCQFARCRLRLHGAHLGQCQGQQERGQTPAGPARHQPEFSRH